MGARTEKAEKWRCQPYIKTKNKNKENKRATKDRTLIFFYFVLEEYYVQKSVIKFQAIGGPMSSGRANPKNRLKND